MLIGFEGLVCVPPDCGPAQPEPVEYYGDVPPVAEMPDELPKGSQANDYHRGRIDVSGWRKRVDAAGQCWLYQAGEPPLPYVLAGAVDWTNVPRPRKTPPPQGGSESVTADAARAHAPEREEPPGAEAQPKADRPQPVRDLHCERCGDPTDSAGMCETCVFVLDAKQMMRLACKPGPDPYVACRNVEQLSTYLSWCAEQDRIASAKRAEPAPEQRHPSDWDAWSTAGWES